MYADCLFGAGCYWGVTYVCFGVKASKFLDLFHLSVYHLVAINYNVIGFLNPIMAFNSLLCKIFSSAS